MPFDLKFGLQRIRGRHSGSKAGMRACSVIVRGPGFGRLSDVPLVEGNHEVQALSGALPIRRSQNAWLGAICLSLYI